MAAGLPGISDPPRQLWLDVARPIQPRPRRTSAARRLALLPAAGLQMEMPIAAPADEGLPTPPCIAEPATSEAGLPTTAEAAALAEGAALVAMSASPPTRARPPARLNAREPAESSASPRTATPSIDYSSEPIGVDPVPTGRDDGHAPGRSFAAWLLAQVKQPGTLGELARAARLDRSFPKVGSVDQVRARFCQIGADGDAFAALEDAERDYDRL